MMKNLREKGFTLVEILYALSILCVLVGIAIFHYPGYKNKAYDVLAQEDLRQAYNSAINYFIDHPTGILTRADLENYGFRASPNVKVAVINGRLSNLFLISSYYAPEAKIYVASRRGITQAGASDSIPEEPSPGGGAWASVSIDPQNSNPGGSDPQQKNPTVNSDVVRQCNLATLLDLEEAYGVARAYLASIPEETVTKDILLLMGYIPNENVSLVILDGTSSDLSMSATFNFPGTTNYIVGPSGITSSTP